MIIAAGRKRAGPEDALAQDYLTRAQGLGRSLGFSAIELLDVTGRPPGEPRAEASAILKATPDGAKTVLLDERGQDWPSRTLAQSLAAWRDEGAKTTAFWIGGADGAAQGLKDQADHKLAFGRQTWPHMLVKSMLCEQIYRALTILGAYPYHRD